jgi:hypothetical protein
LLDDRDAPAVANKVMIPDNDLVSAAESIEVVVAKEVVKVIEGADTTPAIE